jgi:hypothetical protein
MPSLSTRTAPWDRHAWNSVPTATLLREKNDLEQLHQSDPAKTRSLPKTQGHSRISVRAGFKKKYSTSTVYGQEYLVPWLASEGPLAYTPEEPPAKDYFFQYSWILPEIFDPEESLRNHFYFGIRYKDGAKFLFQFWERARKGQAPAERQ